MQTWSNRSQPIDKNWNQIKYQYRKEGKGIFSLLPLRHRIGILNELTNEF